MMWYMESKGLLSRYQSVFRKNRSCLVNLAYLESHIMEIFAERKYLIAIFFYLEEAYDRTWRRLVLNRMLKIGFKGHIVHFVYKLFINRTFEILLGNSRSSPRILDNGILQGSVISVILFILAIDEIFEQINPQIKAVMYCDDLCLFLQGKSPSDIKIPIQQSINSIYR
jgi:hypothetical protein